MSTTVRRRTAVALACFLALAATACGDDDEAASPTADRVTTTTADQPEEAEGETVTVTAVDFDFQLSEDSYTAGTYTFEVTNTGAMPHNFAVERDGQRVTGTDILQPGASATVEVTLEAGDYFFYCEVGQHRANGIEVPVTVTA